MQMSFKSEHDFRQAGGHVGKFQNMATHKAIIIRCM